jgi:hypothetical protein
MERITRNIRTIPPETGPKDPDNSLTSCNSSPRSAHERGDAWEPPA